MSRKKSTATRRKESLAASERAAAIRQEQERKERRRRSLVVTVVGVAVLALVLVIGTLVRSSLDSTNGSTETPTGAVGYAVPDGESGAPVTVTVYEDFMCPFCGQFEAASRNRLQAAVGSGKVRMRYHALNFLSRSSSTDYSLRAANAYAAVLDTAGPDAAKRFHDLLFEHQPEEGSAGLSDGQLLDYAVDAGARRSKVSGLISDRTFENWVEKGTSQASEDGVSSTPTVKINGKTVEFKTTAELVERINEATQ